MIGFDKQVRAVRAITNVIGRARYRYCALRGSEALRARRAFAAGGMLASGHKMQCGSSARPSTAEVSASYRNARSGAPRDSGGAVDFGSLLPTWNSGLH